MANYKVGDEVVCIDAIGVINPIMKVGGKHVVAALNDKCVGFGYASINGPGSCHICGESWGMGHFYTWRFIKLDGLTEDQTTENEVTA